MELSLRHASTQLERVISVPADASIRDVKKMFVRPRAEFVLVVVGVFNGLASCRDL